MPEPRLDLLREEEGLLVSNSNAQLRLGQIIIIRVVAHILHCYLSLVLGSGYSGNGHWELTVPSMSTRVSLEGYSKRQKNPPKKGNLWKMNIPRIHKYS